MTIEEIKRWVATEPPAVQQYVGELMGMVEVARRLFTPGEMVAAKAEARSQAYLEAADVVDGCYKPEKYVMRLIDPDEAIAALRQRAEEGK